MAERPIFRITVEDLETGDQQTRLLPKGEYFILCTSPCHVAHTNWFPTTGTAVITVKGRTAKS